MTEAEGVLAKIEAVKRGERKLITYASREEAYADLGITPEEL